MKLIDSEEMINNSTTDFAKTKLANLIEMYIVSWIAE